MVPEYPGRQHGTSNPIQSILYRRPISRPRSNSLSLCIIFFPHVYPILIVIYLDLTLPLAQPSVLYTSVDAVTHYWLHQLSKFYAAQLKPIYLFLLLSVIVKCILLMVAIEMNGIK